MHQAGEKKFPFCTGKLCRRSTLRFGGEGDDGFASGLFGIGGGVIITPALCLLTDMPYACVLGTTLASMVPPSLVSATTHHSLGNIVVSAVVPIIAGSALGAFVSAQVAVRAPEELLQWTFAFFIFSQGVLKYRALYGRV